MATFLFTFYDFLKNKEKKGTLSNAEKQILDDLKKKYKDDDRKIPAC